MSMNYIDNNPPIEIVNKPVLFSTAQSKCRSPLALNANWIPVENAYNQFYRNYNGDRKQKIPKILHQIWFGGKPFPTKYQELTNRWLTIHQDWHYILWTEKEIEDLGMTNYNLYNNMVNPSAKSDVARYEIAYAYGGVYVDTDYYAVKPFDDLLYLDFFTGVIGSYDGGYINADTTIAPSIFGCSQGNKMMAGIIQHISQVNVVPKTIPEIMEITGPGMFARYVSENIDKVPMSVAFPTPFFEPYPAGLREAVRNLSIEQLAQPMEHFVSPETYAAHLHYCSWQHPHLL